MCHHADMDIDWEAVVEQPESQTEADEEPELETEESTPDLTAPADD